MKKPEFLHVGNKFALFALVVSFAFLAAWRATDRSAQATKQPLSSGAAGHSAALRVQIDPRTGELVPLSPRAGEPQSPEAARSHSIQGLRILQRAGSHRSVDLEGRFMESVVATIDSSGRIVTGCLPEGNAEKLVRRKTAESSARGER